MTRKRRGRDSLGPPDVRALAAPKAGLVDTVGGSLAAPEGSGGDRGWPGPAAGLATAWPVRGAWVLRAPAAPDRWRRQLVICARCGGRGSKVGAPRLGPRPGWDPLGCWPRGGNFGAGKFLCNLHGLKSISRNSDSAAALNRAGLALAPWAGRWPQAARLPPRAVGSGHGRPKVKAPAEPVSGEDLPPGLQKAMPLLCPLMVERDRDRERERACSSPCRRPPPSGTNCSS